MMFLSSERPGVYQVPVSMFYGSLQIAILPAIPITLFAAPYGFGAFFFQCGAVRSSEWCVKISFTCCSNALFHACVYGIKLVGIKQMNLCTLQEIYILSRHQCPASPFEDLNFQSRSLLNVFNLT
jgi:hypothetical protein